MRLGICAKLAPCYFGQFEILSRIGQVDYQLALPPTLRVHNVFHISILKKYVHDATHVVLQLQLFPKFLKILDPPFKFCLVWFYFRLLNSVVFC